MKKLLTLSLLPLTLVLASCGAINAPQAADQRLKAQFFPGGPSANCIPMDNAVFAPEVIYVSRYPSPSYPNTGVDFTFGNDTMTTSSVQLTAPNGINLSWASKTSYGQASNGQKTTQRFPLLVTASPSLPAGQYTVNMKFTTNYSDFSGCPMSALTVHVQ